jgi:hypothetical protein
MTCTRSWRSPDALLAARTHCSPKPAEQVASWPSFTRSGYAFHWDQLASLFKLMDLASRHGRRSPSLGGSAARPGTAPHCSAAAPDGALRPSWSGWRDRPETSSSLSEEALRDTPPVRPPRASDAGVGHPVEAGGRTRRPIPGTKH